MNDEKDFAGPEHFERLCARRYREAELPVLGWVRMQSLSELEIGEWEVEDIGPDGTRTPEGQKLMKAGLIVRVLVNAAGERRFTSEQRYLVAKADAAVVSAAFELCREHCGIPRRDVDAIAALKAIQKNCEAPAG
jgi:hypothetical protein